MMRRDASTFSMLSGSRPIIGAELRDIDLRETLDASTIEAIHQAWLGHRRRCVSQSGVIPGKDRPAGHRLFR